MLTTKRHPVCFPTAVRLLRCRKTGRYFTGNGWSTDPAEAGTYSNTADAAQACLTHHLHEMELVLRTRITHIELSVSPVQLVPESHSLADR